MFSGTMPRTSKANPHIANRLAILRSGRNEKRNAENKRRDPDAAIPAGGAGTGRTG
jgi:hypothetical protein